MTGWCHSLAVVGATLAIVGWQHMAGAQEQEQEQEDPLIEEGRQLYLTGCSSCHGTDGSGFTNEDDEVRGPSLLESGEAAAYYYLSTGRMPLTNSAEQPRRKQPAYTDEETDALVAYVGSLGEGPRLPEVDLDDADLVEGGELFRANCAPCH
ncbi:MAG: c-type cytochrome, partial [Acidimicrobiales bacterium]